MEQTDYQQKFEELFCTNIKREGAQQLLDWLKRTDFFTAPASTKYHCACEKGLVMHSLSVFETMVEQYFEEGDSMESFAICGLLHDVFAQPVQFLVVPFEQKIVLVKYVGIRHAMRIDNILNTCGIPQPGGNIRNFSQTEIQ